MMTRIRKKAELLAKGHFYPSKEDILRYSIKTRYDMSVEDYETLLNKQNGVCAICGSESSGHKSKNRLSVDHCHSTGKVRGLLCSHCNSALGHFKDSPILISKALDYLNGSS